MAENELRIHDAGNQYQHIARDWPVDAPVGMSRADALSRLIKLREKRRVMASDGYAERQIATQLGKPGNPTEDRIVSFAAEIDFGAALDVEALDLAIQALGGGR